MTVHPEENRPLLVEVEVDIKTYDIDFLGIVNNTVYIRWLEDLRLLFLSEHLPVAEQLQKGYAPIVGRTEIDYKRPLRFGDTPVGRVWLSDTGQARWVLRFEFFARGKIIATAQQTCYCVGLESKRPIPLPAPLRLP